MNLTVATNDFRECSSKLQRCLLKESSFPSIIFDSPLYTEAGCPTWTQIASSSFPTCARATYSVDHVISGSPLQTPPVATRGIPCKGPGNDIRSVLPAGPHPP